MKFLLNTQGDNVAEQAAKRPDLVIGQLLTPLNGFAYWGGVFAIDNGAYARFNQAAFMDRLKRFAPYRDRCLFVAAPDVVGSARRTLEAFRHWYEILYTWPVALVAQNGQEDLPIDWSILSAIFIGGDDAFKGSRAAHDIVKTALAMPKPIHVHCGRVNEPKRYAEYKRLGAHTCDGTGISIYRDEKRDIIEKRVDQPTPLLDSLEASCEPSP